MLKIGLTGNIGSGKTVVTEIFKILGVPVYQADQRGGFYIGTPEVIVKLNDLFGSDIIDINGKPLKKKIADIVFNDQKKLNELNSIIHPLVLDDFERWTAAQAPKPYVMMESAILFETGYISLFDKIIFISAPEAMRLKRVMDRDNISEQEVRSRMQKQQPEKENIKKSDFVIVNDGNESLIVQVLNVHQRITSQSKSF